VFSLDDSNYMAHVFAGLAARELAHQQRAREHYKTAIALQPEEQLAWKVDLSIFKFNLSISQPIKHCCDQRGLGSSLP